MSLNTSNEDSLLMKDLIGRRTNTETFSRKDSQNILTPTLHK